MRHATHLIILEAIQKPAGLPVYSPGPSEPGYKGVIPPPPDFGRNISKIFSIKRPWMANCPPHIFSDLLTALNQEILFEDEVSKATLFLRLLP